MPMSILNLVCTSFVAVEPERQEAECRCDRDMIQRNVDTLDQSPGGTFVIRVCKPRWLCSGPGEGAEIGQGSSEREKDQVRADGRNARSQI
jgi:hypothetical protein